MSDLDTNYSWQCILSLGLLGSVTLICWIIFYLKFKVWNNNNEKFDLVHFFVSKGSIWTQILYYSLQCVGFCLFLLYIVVKTKLLLMIVSTSWTVNLLFGIALIYCIILLIDFIYINIQSYDYKSLKKTGWRNAIVMANLILIALYLILSLLVSIFQLKWLFVIYQDKHNIQETAANVSIKLTLFLLDSLLLLSFGETFCFLCFIITSYVVVKYRNHEYWFDNVRFLVWVGISLFLNEFRLVIACFGSIYTRDTRFKNMLLY